MVQNLNAVSFREYGTVLSERADFQQNLDTQGEVKSILPMGAARMYRVKASTRVRCIKGKAILTVEREPGVYVHFYLDKTVCIKAGVCGSLSPVLGETQVGFLTDVEPEFLGTCPVANHKGEGTVEIDGIYSLFYQEKEPGFLFSGESHPAVELTYVDSGRLHSVVGGKDTILEQGELMFYGPNQWHMQYADMDVAPRFVTLSFGLSRGDITPLLNRKIKAPQHTVTILQRMIREIDNVDDYISDMIISFTHLLLVMLLREQETPRDVKIQNSNTIHNENAIIRHAQQYISTHIREKLSVPMVARQVEVSPSYLTALFQKNLQISPGEYIRRTKLQESKQLIRENNMNFTEIAEALQYSTVHHFSRQFKEKFGITPSEYAKSVR